MDLTHLKISIYISVLLVIKMFISKSIIADDQVNMQRINQYQKAPYEVERPVYETKLASNRRRQLFVRELA
jgi:hypothetical protein